MSDKHSPILFYTAIKPDLLFVNSVICIQLHLSTVIRKATITSTLYRCQNCQLQFSFFSVIYQSVFLCLFCLNSCRLFILDGQIK